MTPNFVQHPAKKIIFYVAGLLLVGIAVFFFFAPVKASAALNPGINQELTTTTTATLKPAATTLLEKPTMRAALAISQPAPRASTQPVKLRAPVSLDTNIPTEPTASTKSRTSLPKQIIKPVKQILIDLSQQRLYLYENGINVWSNLISSGSTYPTPVGTYYIERRVLNETMSGSDFYLENVLYTQYFTGVGHAIHYAWWHNNFGHPMSHGCINMSLSGSRHVWEWANIGTPVIIRN